MNSQELLLQKCREGFKLKLGYLSDPEERKKYGERMKYELEVINKLNFNDYFLIVQDIVHWAKANGIRVGPGRGSAAGSLVAYVLDITEIDPLRFDLIFERFLNKDRVSAPDIDIDFEKRKRPQVIAYIKKKYGEDHVAQIVNYTELNIKSLFKDVGKCLEIEDKVLDHLSSLVPYGSKTISEALKKEKQFTPYVTKYKELFQVCMALEGCMRQTGKHAAGVVITKDKLIESLPILTDGTTIMTQWEKKTLEDLNFLKMDILAVKTLDIIEMTLDFIGDHNALPSADQIVLEDPNILKEFETAKSLGTFQFETPGMRELLGKIKPTSFADLYLINALDRPGAKDSADDFVRNRETGNFDCLGDERLRPILEATYGIVVYQEQVIRLFQEIGGFSASEADIIRRGISAKDPKIFENNREKFLSGAVARGFDRTWANGIFEITKKSESYGFNKSHAVAYSMVGFQTMYLKTYYPLEFLTAALCWVHSNNQPKMRSYENEARRLGIRILPHDINASKNQYTFDRGENAIRRGFASIPFVGKAGAAIEKHQPYHSFSQFYARVPKNIVKANAMKALINAGCFDSIEKDRKQMSKWLDIPVKKKVQPVGEQQQLF